MEGRGATGEGLAGEEEATADYEKKVGVATPGVFYILVWWTITEEKDHR